MSRPTRLVLMLGSLLGFSVSMPASSQAGLIPWTYNAIFGPVGSMRYRTAYASSYSSNGTYGYGAYGPYTGYAPVSYGYAAPAAYAAAPAYSGGGCNCNQSSYYAPAVSYDAFYGGYPVNYANYGGGGCNCQPCSSCSNCSSGNCSSGTCSNCNANMAPLPNNNGSGSSSYGSNTSGYGPNPIAGPIPDPNNTRDVNTRLIEMENRVNRDEHRWNEIEKFLKRFHKNEFQPAPYSGSSGSEVVRPRHSTFESENTTSDGAYPPPKVRKPRDVTDPLEGGVQKPVLPAPLDEEKSNDPQKEEPSTFKESEPVTLRLQDRMTTQAVAPRERMQIVTKQGKTAVAKSIKPQTRTSEQSPLAELARN